MSAEKRRLMKKIREALAKADLYALLLDFRIETMRELFAFARQIREALKGRKVSSDIPDRQIFLTLVAVNMQLR